MMRSPWSYQTRETNTTSTSPLVMQYCCKEGEFLKIWEMQRLWRFSKTRSTEVTATIAVEYLWIIVSNASKSTQNQHQENRSHEAGHPYSTIHLNQWHVTAYARQEKKLNAFHMRFLKRTLGLTLTRLATSMFSAGENHTPSLQCSAYSGLNMYDAWRNVAYQRICCTVN